MMILSEAIAVFLEHVCAGKENETPAAYRTKLRQLVVRMGDRPITLITPNDLDDFRVALLSQKQKTVGKRVVQKPLTPAYVRSVLKTVKHLFRWLADTGRLPLDPAANLEFPKRVKPTPRAVDEEVVEKMCAAARVVGPEWERIRNTALLVALRSSGARIGGLLAATVQNTDVANGFIKSIQKGGDEKKLYLNEAAREAVQRWLETRPQLEPKDDRLFIGQNGRGLSRNGAEKIWNRLARAAGVEDQRHNFHSFRHAFARDSIHAGADLSHVSQLMGHSSTAITGDYYLQYTKDELQEVHMRVSPSVSLADASGVTPDKLTPRPVTGGEAPPAPAGQIVAWPGSSALGKLATVNSSMILLAVGPLQPGLMDKLIEVVNQFSA